MQALHPEKRTGNPGFARGGIVTSDSSLIHVMSMCVCVCVVCVYVCACVHMYMDECICTLNSAAPTRSNAVEDSDRNT